MSNDLDNAFKVMALGFNDEVEPDEQAADYLARKYDVDGERLMEYCEGLLELCTLDEENLRIMFFMGFEFGLVTEKYMADIRRLS